MSTAQRLWSTFPFLIALAVLIFLIWSAFLAIDYPYDGLIWFGPFGEILDLDPSSISSQELMVGDQIISVNSIPSGKHVLCTPVYLLAMKHFW